MRKKDFSHLWVSDVVIAFIVNNLKTKKYIHLELKNSDDRFNFLVFSLNLLILTQTKIKLYIRLDCWIKN